MPILYTDYWPKVQLFLPRDVGLGCWEKAMQAFLLNLAPSKLACDGVLIVSWGNLNQL